MSPLAAVAWGLEFLLELSGAVLAHRKRLRILSALLAWRALMDIATFVLYLSHRSDYAGVMWGGRAVQYAILCALAVKIAAMWVQDWRPVTQRVFWSVALIGSAVAFVFANTALWEEKFIHADAISSLMVLSIVMLAWWGRRKELEEPWKLVLCGVVVGALGNSLCAALYTKWPSALSLYAVPALIALIIWNWSALPPRKTIKLKFADLPLGKTLNDGLWPEAREYWERDMGMVQ